MIDITQFIPKAVDATYAGGGDRAHIFAAFRTNQILSKQALLNDIAKRAPKDASILVIGGWFGFTSFCLSQLGYQNITEIDVDPVCSRVSTILNFNTPGFRHQVADVSNFDVSGFAIVINTSAEHMSSDWFERLAPGTMVFCQTTNLNVPDHSNLCASLEEAKSKYSLGTLFQASEIPDRTYSRYFISGIK